MPNARLDPAQHLGRDRVAAHGGTPKPRVTLQEEINPLHAGHRIVQSEVDVEGPDSREPRLDGGLRPRDVCGAMHDEVENQLFLGCAVVVANDPDGVQAAPSAKQLPPTQLVGVGFLSGIGHACQYDPRLFVFELFPTLQRGDPLNAVELSGSGRALQVGRCYQI